MSDETRKALEKLEAEAQSDMCCLMHPVYHIPCMRDIGHSGKHWFMTRWTSAEEVWAELRDRLVDYQ